MNPPNPRFYPYSAGVAPKIEWLIVGAFVFLSILAWVEILRTLFAQSFGGRSEIRIPTLILFAITLTLITVALILFFKKSLGLADAPPMSHLGLE